jgi:hypothetical protein
MQRWGLAILNMVTCLSHFALSSLSRLMTCCPAIIADDTQAPPPQSQPTSEFLTYRLLT